MTVFPIGEFLPDQPDFNNPGSSLVQNVIWETSQSVGPFPGFTGALTPLTARCQGAFGAKDASGIAKIFAGDAAKLYALNAGAGANFADVSKGGGYTCTVDAFWNFTIYNETVIATDYADAIQAYTLGTSALFADLASAAPKAKEVAVVKNFLMVGNTNDGTYGAQPQRVWWPDVNDITNWPTPGTQAAAAVQSDYQDIHGDHGALQRIIPNVGPVDAVILMERAVWKCMYIGAPAIFGFYPMTGVKGCQAPGSAVLTEVGVIYYGTDGFYLCNGQSAVGIGYGKIDNYVKNNASVANLFRMVATLDPINKIYYVAFASNSSGNGNPDTILACAYNLPSVIGTPGRWSVITGVTVEYLFNSITLGYTLDDLDIFGILDSLGYPLDSRYWTAGAQILAGFNSSHAYGTFSGSNLAPTVETSETQIQPGRRSLVTNTLALMDGGTPSVAAGTRNRLIDSVTYGSASAINVQGFSPLMAEGRYHRFRVTAASGQTFTHIQGVEAPQDNIADSGNV